MDYIGIDLHTNCFTCCFLDSGNQKRIITYHLEEKSLNDFYSQLTLDSYVLIEATVNTFQFAALIEDRVKEVIIANTFALKQISFTNKKTDKVDAEKLARILKVQIISGEEQIVPVTIPPLKIQRLRSLFSTYRLLRKQVTAIKNRIHSLLKQNLYPFTKAYIFGKRSRCRIRTIAADEVLSFQINLLFDELEGIESTVEKVVEKIECEGSSYYKEIRILTSMKGISPFIAIAIISDIISVDRFPNSKRFCSYLRSTPGVESSNEKTIIKSTNKMGRKTSITLLSQSLNHFRDSDVHLNKWYMRMSQYKKKGLLRMALCRKVISEIYQMLKKEEYHYYRDKENHKKKLEKYVKTLIANGVITDLKEIAA